MQNQTFADHSHENVGFVNFSVAARNLSRERPFGIYVERSHNTPISRTIHLMVSQHEIVQLNWDAFIETFPSTSKFTYQILAIEVCPHFKRHDILGVGRSSIYLKALIRVYFRKPVLDV